METLLSSKEIMENARISRATLNNYIALGILPRPTVRKPGRGHTRAPRIGYFPSSALETLKQVEQLKSQGYALAEIARLLNPSGAPAAVSSGERRNPAKAPGAPPFRPHSVPKLTIDHMGYPAYLLNHKFQLEWCNAEVQKDIFGADWTLPSHIKERNIFQLLFDSQMARHKGGFEDILRFHLSLAKGKLSKSAVLMGDLKLEHDDLTKLIQIHDDVAPIEARPVACMETNLSPDRHDERPVQMFATFFREGIFIVYLPEEGERESLLSVLAHRDLVIRSLLRKRRPYLTSLSVLVADLQSSCKICAELPPEEYFELINTIWGAMDPLLRKYYATSGKHVGDGIVYYFFPRPDENHVLNAIRCAQEMKETMVGISRAWRDRKGWANDLLLNIGIDQGEEWFGTYQTATQLEFTVLGDTVNRAGRLSDFAQHGSIWATKNSLSKLTATEREGIRFGIRRSSENGPIVIYSSYSRISGLIDMENPKHEKMQDISGLPVTEIFDVVLPPAA